MPSGSLEQEHLFYLFLKFKIGFIDLQQIFKKCPKHKKKYALETCQKY